MIIVSLLLSLGTAVSSAIGSPSDHSQVRASSWVKSGPLTAVYGDWTTYLGGPARESSGLGDTDLGPQTAANLTLGWSFASGASIVTQPIVVDHVVYVGSENGFEYALNASTGKLIWKTSLGKSDEMLCGGNQGESSTPTFRSGVLYLGGGDGSWDALKASSGAVLWNVSIGNTSGDPGDGFYNWASPLVVGDRAFVGVSSHCDDPLVPGGLDIVDLSDHALIGKFNTTQAGALGASIWSSPSYDGRTNRILVTTGNGPANDSFQDAVIALNGSTLQLASSWATSGKLSTPDGDFGTTPTLLTDSKGQRLVVAANKDGFLFAWNESNLSRGPVWEERIAGAATYSSAAVGNGMIFVGSSKTNLAGHPVNGSLRSIVPSTGSVVWADAFPGVVYAAPVWANGIVAVGGGNEFKVINATGGAVLFTYVVGPKVNFQGAATIAHDWIYVGAKDGVLRAFSLPGSAPGGEALGGAPGKEPAAIPLASRELVAGPGGRELAP